MSSLNKIMNKVDTAASSLKTINEWFDILRHECQVYQFENGQQFLAKRFSQIHYVICAEDTARQILLDNLYALMLNKYFPDKTTESYKILQDVINKFMLNLASSLQTVSFQPVEDDNIIHVQYLPNGCVAFKNGVYDFRTDNWLFRYDTIELNTGLRLVSYTSDYIVQYYLNFNFEPLGIAVKDYELKDFVEALKQLNETQRNLCFELVYNMSFNDSNNFDFNRFEHLCEILGYLCCNSMVEHFSLIFGAGQNGKDSLFHGCFTPTLIPRPSSVSLSKLAEQQFAVGSLERRSHNINLELSQQTFKDCSTIKDLTGGEEIDVERKGVQSYTGTLNCKLLFAGNVQNDIKFSDTSYGFIRRVNVFNVYYTWDKHKRFLTRGKYYDTTFTIDDLKNDKTCTIMFIYLAMFGIKAATNCFTTDFHFTHNEWSLQYADINAQLKTQLESIRLRDMFNEAANDTKSFTNVLMSVNHKVLWREPTLELSQSVLANASTKTIKKWSTQIDDYGTMAVCFKNVNDFIKSDIEFIINDNGDTTDYNLGMEHIEQFDELFISLRYLQDVVKHIGSPNSFSKAIQKIYGQSCIERMAGNQPYVRCTFKKGYLQILK